MRGGRVLRFDGCFNVRDLGGLPQAAGGETLAGAVVRSDDPCKLTAAGWEALLAYGIRTVVSLETRGAPRDDPDRAPRPSGLQLLRVVVEDFEDAPLMDELRERYGGANVWSTPLYHAHALARWPERSAAAVRAIANAGPGGVLVHCGAGRDRTGLVSLLLLALCDVVAEAIVDDYELSYAAMRSAGHTDELGEIHALLEHEGTTSTRCLRSTLDALDAEGMLRSAGLAVSEIAAVRRRLCADA